MRQIVSLIVFIVTAATCGLLGLFVTYEMMDQVNAKLPTAQQFSPLWWYYGKHRRLLTEYRRFYPAGSLDKKQLLLSAVSMTVCVLASWGIGFPLFGVLWLAVGGIVSLWFGFRR